MLGVVHVEQETLKITGVLSDPTRFSIYQYVARQHRDVTVQEIAERFKIHANVARLHLTKLEDVNMLVSSTKKTGRGGRPSRFYRLSDEVISLQFPYRDYQKLAEMALEALLSFGEAGEKTLIETGEKFGMETAQSYVGTLEQNLEQMSPQEKIKFIEKISLNQGLNPEIEYDEELGKISFKVYNCTFKELVHHSPVICKMHHAFLNGIFKYFFDDIELHQDGNMLQEEYVCTYSTSILIPAKA